MKISTFQSSFRPLLLSEILWYCLVYEIVKKKLNTYILSALFDALLHSCVYSIIFHNFCFGLGPKTAVAYI